MSFVAYRMERHINALRRFYQMHELILQENTGTPDQFAEHLKISRRLLYSTIGRFNDFGCSVKYNRIRKTFYYGNNDGITIASILKSFNSCNISLARVSSYS